MELEQVDLGWLAGIIDGEGSVSLDKRHKAIYRYPAVSVPSTDKDILIKCQRLAGGTITERSPRNIKYKKTWQWRLRGVRVIEFLREIDSLLMCPKKRHRAKFIVDKYNKVTSRNGFYTKKTLKQRLQFQEQFFKL